MEFLLVIVLIFVVWSHIGISNRISKIEEVTTKKVPDSLKHGLNQAAPTSFMPQTVHEPKSESTASEMQATTPPPGLASLYSQEQYQKMVADMQQERSENNMFVEWIKRDFLMKIGALLFLMGLGWFVSYAFAHNWIGPAGRITLGLLTGAGILLLGAWRIRTHEHQGAVLTVLGSTTVLITVTTAQTLYDMFIPIVALGLIFMSVLFVTFVSLKYHRNSLALASLVLAGLAPYFSDIPSVGITVHCLYLLAITIGTLWIVFITGWRNLTLAALVIVFLSTTQYMVPYMATPDERVLALVWAFIFTGIFFVANIVSLIRQRGGITSQTNLYTALGTALFLIIWIFDAASKELQSLLFVAWALVFAIGAYLVVRSTDIKSPFYVYGGTAVGLIIAATIAEFEGSVLTIVFMFEVAAVVVAASAMRLSGTVVRSLSLLFVGPILLSFESIFASEWSNSVFHEHFFTLIIMTLVLAVVGLFIHERHPDKTVSPDHAQYGTTLLILSALYALTLIWLVPHAAFYTDPDVGTTIALIVYTLLGMYLYYVGKTGTENSLRVAGGILLGFVVCRLLFVEVWEMDLAERIVTFIAIGILLISTAFIKKGSSVELTQK